jgi:hypothetical protein
MRFHSNAFKLQVYKQLIVQIVPTAQGNTLPLMSEDQ